MKCVRATKERQKVRKNDKILLIQFFIPKFVYINFQGKYGVNIFKDLFEMFSKIVLQKWYLRVVLENTLNLFSRTKFYLKI